MKKYKVKYKTDKIGKIIVSAREKLRMSQYDLAKAAGLSQGGLWHLENGKTLPQTNTARKLSAVLGISIDELLDSDKLTKLREQARKAEQVFSCESQKTVEKKDLDVSSQTNFLPFNIDDAFQDKESYAVIKNVNLEFFHFTQDESAISSKQMPLQEFLSKFKRGDNDSVNKMLFTKLKQMIL